MHKKKPKRCGAELAPFYDVLYLWKDYAAEAARVHQLIQTHRMSSGNALLDVACGTGEHTRFLREHYDVTGVDLNRGNVEGGAKEDPRGPVTLPGYDFFRPEASV